MSYSHPGVSNWTITESTVFLSPREHPFTQMFSHQEWLKKSGCDVQRYFLAIEHSMHSLLCRKKSLWGIYKGLWQCVYIYVCVCVQDMRERERQRKGECLPVLCVSLHHTVFCIFAVPVVSLSCLSGPMYHLHVWAVEPWESRHFTCDTSAVTERPAGGPEWQRGGFCYCLCLPQRSQPR